MHAAHAAAHPDWAARQRARPPARARLNAGIPAPATAAAPPSRRRGARGGGRDVRRGGQPEGEKSGWKPPTRRGGRRERWMSAVWPAPNAAWRRSARRVCRGGRRSTWLHGIGLIPTARPIDRRSDITSCARWARPGRAQGGPRIPSPPASQKRIRSIGGRAGDDAAATSPGPHHTADSRPSGWSEPGPTRRYVRHPSASRTGTTRGGLRVTQP